MALRCVVHVVRSHGRAGPPPPSLPSRGVVPGDGGRAWMKEMVRLKSLGVAFDAFTMTCRAADRQGRKYPTERG